MNSVLHCHLKRPKNCYIHREDAEAELERLTKSHGKTNPEQLNIYFCREHWAWHIGHSKEKP